ncbi:uncharacterized protein [Palaemon carinicauda]|uniref:uncharacterized protein isoform X2 n=1 Tax=Palaemon carinicauda TaxID=392227 RepID=UPI0035B582B1
MNEIINTKLTHLTVSRPRPRKNHPPTKVLLFSHDEAESAYQNFFPRSAITKDELSSQANRKRDSNTSSDIQPYLSREPLVSLSPTPQQTEKKRKKLKTKRERASRLGNKVRSMYTDYLRKSARFKESVVDTNHSGREGTSSLGYHESGSAITNSLAMEAHGTLSLNSPIDSCAGNTSVGLDSCSSPTDKEDRSQVIIPKSRRVKSLARVLQPRIYNYSPICLPENDVTDSNAQCNNDSWNTGEERDSLRTIKAITEGPVTHDVNTDLDGANSEKYLPAHMKARSLLAADLDEKNPQHAKMEEKVGEISQNPSDSLVPTEAEIIFSDVTITNKAFAGDQQCVDSPTSSTEEYASVPLRKVRSEESVNTPLAKDIPHIRSEILRQEGNSRTLPCRRSNTSRRGRMSLLESIRDDDILCRISSKDDYSIKDVKNRDRCPIIDEVHDMQPTLPEDYNAAKLKRSSGIINVGMKHNSLKTISPLSLPGQGGALPPISISRERRYSEGSLRSCKAQSIFSSSKLIENHRRSSAPFPDVSTQLLGKMNRKSLPCLVTKENQESIDCVRSKFLVRKKKIVARKTRKVAPSKPPRSRTKAKTLDNNTGVALANTHLDISQGSSHQDVVESEDSTIRDNQLILHENQETIHSSENRQLLLNEIRERRHSEATENRSTILLADIDEEDIVTEDGKTPSTMRISDYEVASGLSLDTKTIDIMNHDTSDRKSMNTMLQEDKDLSDTPKKPPRPSIAIAKNCNLQDDQDLCSDHQALLDLYCSKCRLVICEKCQESSHSSKTHKILSTPDALSMLRFETVTLLRHYSLLRSMFMTLKGIYSRYANSNQNMKQVTDEIYSSLHLDDDLYLSKVVEEAEAIGEKAKNLSKIKEKVKEWETHQHDWGHIVYLAMRCQLLANINAANDTVFIRVKEWLLPTPWIHLSHLLQPYLRDDINRTTLTPVRKGSVLRKKEDRSSHLNQKGSIGLVEVQGKDVKMFPYNSKSVLIHSLLPYIIFNPVIRYFMHIKNNLNTDMTLIMEPSEEHVHHYLSRQRYTATYSPGTLRRNGYEPSDDPLTIVEKQMMMGGKQRSRLIASYTFPGTTGSSSTGPVLVKVAFPDIKVAPGVLGLAVAVGSLKTGDIIVDSDPNRGHNLSVVITNVGEISALRFGHIIKGFESFKYLIEKEEKRRSEGMGIRAKIRATVKREEEATYEITFGLDI